MLYLWPAAIAVFGLRLAGQIVVLSLAQKRFNEKGMIFLPLIFDIFSPLINVILFLGSYRFRAERNTWK
jgi:hypothetical protein